MKFFSRNTPQGHDAVVERLTERIAHDNAIDAASDAKCVDMLVEAVQAAIAYARSLIDALGEPFALDRNGAADTALGPVLFDSRKDAVDALRNATSVRAVFNDPRALECVFLLTMHRHEYVFFGTEIQGEIARRDVMQNAVEFLDHNFPAAAPSLPELRETLTDNIVLFLANLARERLRRDEALRSEIQRSEEFLKAQMRTLDYARKESRPFAARTPLHAKAVQGAREMDALRGKLSTIPVKSDPQKCLYEIRDTLLAPQRHLQLEEVEMWVGDFGVKSEKGKRIRFHECLLGGEERLAVFMASLDRENARYLWPDLDS